MSVDNPAIVDAIGVESDSRRVILTISDHLDWSDEQEHLFALQEKINTYLRLIESGELEVAYPDARGRVAVIDVVGKYELTEGARAFFRSATSVLRDARVELRTRHLLDVD